MKKTIKIFNIIIALFFLFLFMFSIIKQDYIENLISNEIDETYSLFMIFLISSLLEFIPQYISPHIILLNTWIIGIPIFQILIITIIGSIIGSIIGFEVGRKSGSNFIKSIYGEKEIEIIGKKINEYGKWFVLVASVSPLPYVPIIFGSLDLTRKNFIFFGVIPRIIGLLLLGFLFL